MIEGLARRAIFMLAAMEGPLPAAPRRPSAPAKPRSAPAPKPEAAPRAPLFRLTEAARKASRPAATPLPSIRSRTNAPPALETDLIPAGRIARRLAALDAVFCVYPHILRMRRLIGQGAERILTRAAARAPVKTQALTQHRMLADTDDLAASAARSFDSS